MLSLSKQIKSKSIVKRVTAWYALLISGLLLIIAILVFSVSGYISNRSVERHLVEEATEISLDLDDFETYDDGIYFILYDEHQSIKRGIIPSEFDSKLPYNNEEIKSVKTDSKRYTYYDTKINKTNQWLRAITPTSEKSNDMKIFIISLSCSLPIFLLTVITGGYLILKQAFLPVSDMVRTAKSITKEKDYSKRLTSTVKDVELRELADSFNLMLDSIEDSFQREKQFNHDVSHELRTPLSVILAESDFGQHYVDSIEEAKESYQAIYRQGRKMKDLIEQILELSRVDNMQTLKAESVQLDQVIQEQAKDYQILANQKGLVLTITLQEEIVIQGNQLLLIRLLDNLFSNALKYAKTQIGISLKTTNEMVELLVWDDGIGIPKEHHHKIWNRFFQIDTTRQQRHDSNSGLGLSLVKRIVELHRASIAVESEENKGTTFKIHFPKQSF